MVSYTENVKELLKACSTPGTSTETISTLFLETFQGRRKEFIDGKILDVESTLTKACPVLNQLNYVSICFFYRFHYVYILYF